jgi:hypothetical protein
MPDRLVFELRLADAWTLEQAQQVVTEYLPRFNAQFAVALPSGPHHPQTTCGSYLAQTSHCIQTDKITGHLTGQNHWTTTDGILQM